ncbi:peroxin-10 [Marchantia polymorpha subsp. ruderalis]|uniref:RING-type E3 ubiquitin transferase n=2 Tax=Marchantia polymorpha TaxID=3197 RepID=A0A176WJ68_MARPO|nr:hypothetical protein AXG93_1913s1710 [Marchantia polymorpha subsp. ruderalis]PTQ42534.1 hypothetical protein MARPO_0029s0064 [Marchantia polymorpha]BBM96948.1 hypothetical protein Mp_1g01820 [Marchantia polymorpha subsp. ruderalis]|eukprot:PTQ42534.1 hypothetical protein MARPO_0029s0064 [Marchantia polymorpha]
MSREEASADVERGITPSDTTSQRSEDVIVQFAAAAQPEMMRAAEKDEHYVGQVCEACYDAFRHTFGTRLAVAYQNEMKLAGRVLYYLLTTGSGLQTLGEEYCDIVQVAGVPGLPATPARRTLLVFYQTVLPYLAERLSSRAAAQGMALGAEDEPNDMDIVSQISSEEESADREASGSERLASSNLRRNALEVNSRSRMSLTGGLRQAWMTALRRWAMILPSVREALMLFVRTHLMLFYFEGIYYHMGKRAAGIRYIFTGRPTQQRPRYHMLGLFLFIQLSFVCGDWLTRTVFPSIASSMRSRAAYSSVSPADSRGIAVIDEDGGKLDDKGTNRQSSRWADAEAPGSSKCPLCLSARQHPTATPCGHVFCWNCVAEWCNEKPECPLCRAPVTHPELVCVYHADF